MKTYSLANIDDLTTILQLGREVFTVRLYGFRDITYADVLQNNEYIVAGKRVMIGDWILPKYLVSEFGNVRFEAYSSDSDEYVWYTGYNTKFRLVSFTANEIKAMEA